MPPTLPARSQKRVAILRGLAHPSRLLIAEALMERPLCVCEIRELVGDDLSTVSKHLAVLRRSGIVESEKRGLNVYYRLSCDCFGEFLHCVDTVCAPPTVPRSEPTSCCL